MSESNAPREPRMAHASQAPRAPGARLRALWGVARRRSSQTWLLFPLFSLALLMVAWGSVIHVIVLEHTAAANAAIESSRELADTYEAQVVRNLVSIDQTLKTVAYAYAVRGDAALSELQNKDMLPSAIVFQVTITDRRGDITASTRREPAVNLANEPYFVAQAQGDGDHLYIGRAGVDRESGAPAIIFSRRLSDAAGRFAGIAMLTVDPSYFTSSYDQPRMGRLGFLGLLGSDGWMRVQQTGDDVSWGAALTAGSRPSHSTGTLAVEPWDDGIERFTNVRVLHGFPLTAIVGLSRDEQLAHYRHDRFVYVMETAAGSVLLVLLTTILGLKSWQLAKSRARARQLQQTYFVASEASLDAFFVWERVPGETARHGARAADAAHAGFVLRDVSRRGTEMIGSARTALVGAPLDTVFADHDEYRTARDEFASVFDTGEVEEREWQHPRPDGSKVWLHRQVVRVDNGVVAIVRDVTSRKRAEARRIEQNRVLEMIATSTPLEEVLGSLMHLLESQIPGCACAVLLRDDDGLHIRVGAAPSLPASFSRVANGALIGPEAGPSGLAIYTHQPVFIADLAAGEGFGDAAYEAHMAGFMQCRSMPILSHDGNALGALTIFVRDDRDPDGVEAQMMAMAIRIAGIAIERTQAEERIRHMANHDSLTGLPNRTLLADRLSQVLLHAQRYQRGVTVVFVDLDNFKLINDSLGHRAGDDLLKTVAARMVSCVRSTDTVVRLGGDEFVLVLFDDAPEEGAVKETIERLRNAILEPVELAGQKYQVTCSMGLASYPADGEDTETLLMNADAAMYRAKELGRNNYQFYTSEMNIKVHERLRRQEMLREALSKGEFRVVYQPQVDARTGQIFGVEALLRWDHPSDGTIAPADFIPLAEETGLIVPIGDWVLQTACEQNRRWQDAGLPPVTVSVNVSARQFMHKGWIASVAEALARTGLDPRYLELELTESLIMQDLEGAIATMKRLQEMGVQLSIDDFGTGYSSLSALKHFPIVRLKIDRSFVSELPHGEDDKAIAMAVISLGQRLNLNVIAEGVETQAQVDFLRDNNCHEIQGYHFSKPVAPDHIEAMLRDLSRDAAEAVEVV